MWDEQIVANVQFAEKVLIQHIVSGCKYVSVSYVLQSFVFWDLKDIKLCVEKGHAAEICLSANFSVVRFLWNEARPKGQDTWCCKIHLSNVRTHLRIRPDDLTAQKSPTRVRMV